MNTIILAVLLFADKTVVVDLNQQAWLAIQDGKIVRAGSAIGGRKRCPENRKRNCMTPVGIFKVLAKRGYGYRSGKYPIECKNRRTCGARMYYFMPFHKAGIGLHGSDMMVGRHESHGCVRLYKEDAAWLNKHFVEIGTEVIVLPYQPEEKK